MHPGRARANARAAWRRLLLVCATVVLLGAPASNGFAAKPNPDGGRGLPRVSARLTQHFPADRASARAAERTRAPGALAGALVSPDADAVGADVVFDRGAGVTPAALRATGVEVVALAARHGRATVRVPSRAALERLAALAGVRRVGPVYPPIRRVGAVTSRAVEALRVDRINGGPAGLTGAGVTVGILSDSLSRTDDVVDDDTTFTGPDGDTTRKTSSTEMSGSAPQDSGDLPASVRILRDDAPDTAAFRLADEGAAMAELIHDLAPDADIVFHTAVGGGIAGFAAAIDRLCASGVDVVIDDIGYLAELMYQRDVVSRAAEDCVGRGVAYFSAAGNNADRAFHERFDDLHIRDDQGRASPSTLDDVDFHDWHGGDPYLRVRVPANSVVTAVLQWNQPALSVPENATRGPRIDLDLIALDRASRYATPRPESAFEDQLAGADPLEIVRLATGSSAHTFYLAIDHWSGAQERIPQDDGTGLEFRLVFFERGADSTIEYLDSPGGPDAAPTMYGHTLAEGVLAVGAVPWFDAPDFPGGNVGPTAEIDPEPFTAVGGTLERHFAPDGRFRRATRPPQPAIAAADGNNTTFFGQAWPYGAEAGESDGFPNFFGTSAAAPNAAAVAALLLEDDPTLAPVQLAAKLRTAAIDVAGLDAATGCDARTGSGLIDAEAALAASDRAPRADAGDGRDAKSGDRITLDGSASSDNHGIDAWRWRQVAGSRVALTNADGAQTHFEAPDAGGTLVFELRVRDAACLSDADRVAIRVEGNGGAGSLGFGGWLLFAALAIMRRPRLRRASFA